MTTIQHAQFQMLSSCEAQQMQKAVGDMVLNAYAKGMNVVLANYEKHDMTDLLEANRSALTELGFTGENLGRDLMIRVLHKSVGDGEK